MLPLRSGSFSPMSRCALWLLSASLTVSCGPHREGAADAGPGVAEPSTSRPGSEAPATSATLEEHAARLHKSAIVVDGHNDITSIILTNGFDLAKPTGKTHTDLPRMKAGGITGEFFSIYVDRVFAEKPTSLGGGSARRALDL